MSGFEIKEPIQTDVIVVGSGLAGLVAALEVEKQGGRVLLVSRGALGKSTCTGWSAGGFTVAREGFSQQEHRERTLRCGHFINDPLLVEELITRGPKLLQQYREDYNIHLEDKKGSGYRVQVEKGFPGQGLINPLCQAVLVRKGITLLEKVMLKSLITVEGVVQGAVGLSSQGEVYPLTGKAVILASGGYSGLYPRNDNPPGITGVPLIQGALAGAGLMQLEFIQFYPLGFAHPRLPDFSFVPPFPPGIRLYNGEKEDILQKHFPEGVDLETATIQFRDRLSRVMAQELRRGGSLYLDLSSLSKRDWEKYYCTRLLKGYRSFQGEELGVAPIAHYTMGGLVIDPYGRTGVQGLYGAGEVTGGFHGANRLGGNALTACLVSGYQAGDTALAEGVEIGEVDPSSFWQDLMELEAGTGEEIRVLIKDLRELVGTYLGPIRSGEGLKILRQRLQGLRERLKGVRIGRGDLWDLLDFQSMLLLSRFMAQGAQKRQESRGAHYREDYPQTSPKPELGEPIYWQEEE